MLPRTLAMLPALLLSGCIVAGGGTSTEMQDIENARLRWNGLEWENYDMRITRSCFCMGAGAYDVQVRDDSVVFARPVEDQGYRIDPAWWSELFPTVDGLLDMAERAEREAGNVEVAWDENGWPTTLNIDWIEQAVDDEMYYAVEWVTEAPDGDVADVRHGATVNLLGLSIRFDGIVSDSRCPGDVQCIWAGEASARFTVTPPGGQPVEVVLSDNPTVENQTGRVVVGGVALRLLVVTPYPQQAGVEIPAGSYQVRILAEKA